MSTNDIELNADTFEQEVLESDLPVVVYFWAQWCNICSTMSPVLDELAQSYAKTLKIGRVDIDAQRALTNEHRIQDTPTLIFFHKGHILRRLTGEASRNQLEEMFEHMAEVAAE